MYKLACIAFCCITQPSFSQTNPRMIIPGTKCSMIPPDGFTLATAFSGFQDNTTGSSIMINEIPAPYLSMIDGFTAEALKSKGMTLVDKQIIDFNQSKATLITVTQPANGATYWKQMLIFGDSAQTILINGIYPEMAKPLEEKMKAALLSTVYDASQVDNPLDAVSFTIDVENTEFKLVKYIAGSLLYSTDGKIPTQKPTFIVASSFSKRQIHNRKEFAKERLKKLPGGEGFTITAIEEITIDSLNGYEIVADGKTGSDQPELMYQVMLYNNEGNYYIMVGQTREALQTYLSTFKNIAKTFKRK